MRIFLIAATVLIVDQVTKFVVATTMFRHQSIPVLGDWLKLTYTENPGMAFGITFGPPWMISVAAITATVLISFYLFHVRRGYLPYRLSLACILGGALGNIIDRVFYARIFGYNQGQLFHGQVVDFIHVDLWSGFLPDSLPLIGGSYVALFPIWNVADMAIVLGVVGILVFQHRFHEQLLAERTEGVAEPARNGASAAADGAASDDAAAEIEALTQQVSQLASEAKPSSESS